jgi:hypothetical protein
MVQGHNGNNGVPGAGWHSDSIQSRSQIYWTASWHTPFPDKSITFQPLGMKKNKKKSPQLNASSHNFTYTEPLHSQRTTCNLGSFGTCVRVAWYLRISVAEKHSDPNLVSRKSGFNIWHLQRLKRRSKMWNLQLTARISKNSVHLVFVMMMMCVFYLVQSKQIKGIQKGTVKCHCPRHQGIQGEYPGTHWTGG